jgi:hypothetical protein
MAAKAQVKCKDCGMLTPPYFDPCVDCVGKQRAAHVAAQQRPPTALGRFAGGLFLLAGLAYVVYESSGFLWRHVGVHIRAEYCEHRLQGLLEKKIPLSDPKVEKCSVRDGENILCFVKALDGGEYKTVPLEWNCDPSSLGWK